MRWKLWRCRECGAEMQSPQRIDHARRKHGLEVPATQPLDKITDAQFKAWREARQRAYAMFEQVGSVRVM